MLTHEAFPSSALSPWPQDKASKALLVELALGWTPTLELGTELDPAVEQELKLPGTLELTLNLMLELPFASKEMLELT